MKIKIAHLPKELKKGFWDLKKQTGIPIPTLLIVALHHGLMHIKNGTEALADNPHVKLHNNEQKNN